MRILVVAIAGPAFITLFAACQRSTPVRDHASLTSLGQLQTAFNADSGKVRAIFLASPT